MDKKRFDRAINRYGIKGDGLKALTKMIELQDERNLSFPALMQEVDHLNPDSSVFQAFEYYIILADMPSKPVALVANAKAFFRRIWSVIYEHLQYAFMIVILHSKYERDLLESLLAWDIGVGGEVSPAERALAAKKGIRKPNFLEKWLTQSFIKSERAQRKSLATMASIAENMAGRRNLLQKMGALPVEDEGPVPPPFVLDPDLDIKH